MVLTKGGEQHEPERDKKIGNAFTWHLADRDGSADKRYRSVIRSSMFYWLCLLSLLVF